ncbi:diaminopimelate epimerase [Fodinibius sediminis]|uniref:Diaminopimelate epimerase n=1 Tax=Fodinibius sediminis TaxID=1214077 RepID=A0A521BUP7_9BACT|nr:diaminopimelate epimerase [Fodinibius sediminis]SMO50893.1 diaminopimelate epimerase [Fodinibius sediminis]
MMTNDNRQTIPFTKMQGAGNDFVVVNNTKQLFSQNTLIELTPKLCDRKYGVGSDGLLALCRAEQDEADYTMFYRNPDGSDAGMCGNGARCIALFARTLGFGEEHTFNVHDRLYRAIVTGDHEVRISFPVETSVNEIMVNNRKMWELNTGTEHVVVAVDSDTLQQKDHLREDGETLRYHSAFQPRGTNVNFISGIHESKLRLQTYERGVENLTLACGTGAIASALAWHHLEKPTRPRQPYEVITEGGVLRIYFKYNPQTLTYSNLELEGPAHFVFEGSYFI